MIRRLPLSLACLCFCLLPGLLSAVEPSPWIVMPSGSYGMPVAVVVLKCPPWAAGEIRMTIDGTEPVASSPRFERPFVVADDTVVRARCFVGGQAVGVERRADYRIRFFRTVQRPVATPASGTYHQSIQVTLVSGTPGAVIRYTVDGTLPDARSPRFVAPITIADDTVLRARAWKRGWFASGVTLAEYRIVKQVAPLALAPPGGHYRTSQTVTMTTATPDAAIHYTLDGSEPGPDAPRYLAPVPVDIGLTIRARAFAPDLLPSPVVEGVYALQAQDPVIVPAGGTFTQATVLTATSATPQAVVRVTTAARDPVESDPVAGDGIAIDAPVVAVRARAFRAGWLPSEVVHAAVDFQVATPLIAPLSGPVERTVTVSATTSTPGATLRYTLDGSLPTAESAELVDGREWADTGVRTLTVIGFRPGYQQSAPAQAVYAFPPVVALADAAPQRVAESIGTVAWTVRLDRPADRPLTVQWEAAFAEAPFGQATVADVVLPAERTLAFAVGEQEQVIAIAVVDDTTHEPEEALTITLTAVTGGQLGSALSADLTIIDDDLPPSVAFGAATITAAEADGLALLPVVLSEPSGFPVRVTYARIGGSATVGGDIAPVSGSLVITAGEAGAVIPITIFDDLLSEPDETVIVAVQAVAPNPLGEPAVATVLITSEERLNVVVAWNAQARAFIARHHIDPPMAARHLALLGVAQRRAVRQHDASGPASLSGAVVAASAAVLTGLYPQEADAITALAQAHVADPAWRGHPEEDVLATQLPARRIGLLVLAAAAGDGSELVWTGSMPSGPEYWYPSWAYAGPPLRPAWPQVRPWFLARGDAIRPPPPPAFGSAVFLDALGEVRDISDRRTDEQLRIVGRWVDGPGSATPPGHWCATASDLLIASGWDDAASAEVMGLLGATLMDAGIACWDSKYAYWTIRPYQADRSITTPAGQPNFPSFVSGHATFSAAGADILAHFFPERAEWLRAEAEEAALSRLYGGIHYRFDNDTGLALGRALAAQALADHVDGIWQRELAPVIVFTAPQPGTVLATSPVITGRIIDDRFPVAVNVIVTLTDADGTIAATTIATAADADGALSFTITPVTPLGEGIWTLAVRATDAEGHMGSAVLPFGLDPDGAPTVIIDAPLDQAVVGLGSPVTVSGRVDQDVRRLTLNGNEIALDAERRFTLNLPIEANAAIRGPLSLFGGINEILVVATDRAGNSGRARIEVLVDDSRPRLHVESPADGSSVTTATVVVAGQVEDLVLGHVDAENVTVTVGGVAAPVRNAGFLLGGVALAEGLNEIDVVATDAAGNRTETAVRVTRIAGLRGLRLSAVSGDLQEAPVRGILQQPCAVRVTDQNGEPIAQHPVTFTVSRGDGSVVEAPPSTPRSYQVLTDATGVAQATLRLGSRSGLGNHRLAATTLASAESVTFTASALSGAPVAVFIAAGDQQTGLLNAELPEPLLAWVSDEAGNPAAGVAVRFAVEQGAGTLVPAGGEVLSTTPLIVRSDADGRVAARLRVGSTPTLEGIRITASVDTESPHHGATFVASAVASSGRAEDTAILGVVLSTEHTPIAGVTILIDGTTRGAVSDANGAFRLAGVPAGHRHLIVNGTTASRVGARYPTIGFEVDLLLGAELRMPMPIYLPVMDQTHEVLAGGDDPVTLPLPGVPGAEVVIAPGSTIRADGTKGPVWMYTSPVNALGVPMPPPDGFFPPQSATLQPSGTRMDPPAQVRWPNLQGLPPGAQVPLLSFDHDLGQFVSQGAMTVDEDGAYLVTDAGSGLGKAGWYFPVSLPVPSAEVVGEVELPEDPCEGAIIDGPDTIFVQGGAVYILTSDDPQARWDLRPGVGSSAAGEIVGSETGTSVTVRATAAISGPDLPPTANTLVLTTRCGDTPLVKIIRVVPVDPLVDIDIDSLNRFDLSEPASDEIEEQAEEAPHRLGKIVLVAQGDRNADAIPDLADGFRNDHFDHAGADRSAGFVPLVIAIPAEVNPTQARVRIEYPASDPGLVTLEAAEDPEEGPRILLPDSGEIRIWRTDGGAARDASSIDAGGDYVAPGSYDYDTLGLQARPDGSYRGVLYVEGIRATPDGDGTFVTVTLEGVPTPPIADDAGMAAMTDRVRVSVLHVQPNPIALRSGEVRDGVTLVDIAGLPSEPARRKILLAELVGPWTLGWDQSGNALAYLLDPRRSDFRVLAGPGSGRFWVPADLQTRVLGGLVPDLGDTDLPTHTQLQAWTLRTPNLPDRPESIAVVSVTRPAMTLRVDGFGSAGQPSYLPPAPWGSQSLLGSRGTIRLDVPTDFTQTAQWSIYYPPVIPQIVRDLGIQFTDRTELTVAGDRPGAVIAQVQARIDGIAGNLVTVLEVPIPVDIPSVLTPQAFQLPAIRTNVATARSQPGAATVAWVDSPNLIPGQMLPSIANPNDPPTVQALDEVIGVALTMAAEILPPGRGWILPFGTSAINGVDPLLPFAESLNTTDVIGAQAMTSEQLAGLIMDSDDGSSSIDQLGDRLASSGFAPNLWARMAYHFTASDLQRPVARHDDESQRVRHFHEVMARQALDKAALAGFKKYVALGKTPAEILAQGATQLPVWRQNGFIPDWVAVEENEQWARTEEAFPIAFRLLVPESHGRNAATVVLRHRRSILEWARDAIGASSRIERFFNGILRVQGWSMSHPFTVDVLQFMQVERMDVARAALEQLQREVPDPSSPGWPIHMRGLFIRFGHAPLPVEIPLRVQVRDGAITLESSGPIRKALDLDEIVDGLLDPAVVLSPLNGSSWSGVTRHDLQAGSVVVRIAGSTPEAQSAALALLGALSEVRILQELLADQHAVVFDQYLRQTQDPWSVALTLAADALFGLKDVIGAWEGRDFMSGENLTWGQRIFTMAMAGLDLIEPGIVISAARGVIRASRGAARRVLQDLGGDLATNTQVRDAVTDGVQAGQVADNAVTVEVASARRTTGTLRTLDLDGLTGMFGRQADSVADPLVQVDLHAGTAPFSAWSTTHRGTTPLRFQQGVGEGVLRELPRPSQARSAPRTARDVDARIRDPSGAGALALRSAESGDAGKIIWRDLCDECFPAGTRIALADGTWQEIEAVTVGTRVLTRDQYDPQGSFISGIVRTTFQREAPGLIRVRLSGGSGPDVQLECTHEHPFWLIGSGWTAAQDLPVGGLVAGVDTDWRVAAVTAASISTPVYNLEVAGTHTYVVAAPRGPPQGVWVHNWCTKEDAIAYLARADMAPFVRLVLGKAADAAISPEDLSAVYRGMVNTRREVLSRLRTSGPDFWTLSSRLRGEFMEQLLSMNLSRNFPVIDGWDGVARKATSLKTLDLGSGFYNQADLLDRTVRKYIDDFDQWKSASGLTDYKAQGGINNFDRAGNNVIVDLTDPTFVRSKELILAVPAGSVYTPGHRALLGKLQAYAAGLDTPITLTIIEVP